MKHPLPALALTLAALLPGRPAEAAPITFDMPYTCPVGGEKFTDKQRVAVTQTGRMLDLKAVGNFEGLWPPLPVCPGNGLPLYRKDFKPEELDRLKPWVASPEFAAMRAAETPHYVAAKTAAFLGEPADEVANRFLVASWSARNPAEYERYAGEALARMQALLADPAVAKSENGGRFQLLSGELERRLGRFAESRARLEGLQADDRFKAPFLAKVITTELELVAAKDSAEHPLPK